MGRGVTKTLESGAGERGAPAAIGGNPADVATGAGARRARGKDGPWQSARSRAALSKERILAEALRLVDERGLAGFTTRRLGERLGCEAMSIYHHFPGKQQLLDAMVEHALAGIVEPPAELDPTTRLRLIGGAYRAMAQRHPRLFPRIAVLRANAPAGVAFRERLLHHCHALLPDDDLAAQACQVLHHYLTGAALDETAGCAPEPVAGEAAGAAEGAGETPHPATAAPIFAAAQVAAAFELGFEMILEGLRGLRARSPAETMPRPKPIVRPKR